MASILKKGIRLPRLGRKNREKENVQDDPETSGNITSVTSSKGKKQYSHPSTCANRL